MSKFKVAVYETNKAHAISKSMVLTKDAIFIEYMEGFHKVSEHIFKCNDIKNVRCFKKESSVRRGLIGRNMLGSNKDGYYVEIVLNNSNNYIYRIERKSIPFIFTWRKENNL